MTLSEQEVAELNALLDALPISEEIMEIARADVRDYVRARAAGKMTFHGLWVELGKELYLALYKKDALLLYKTTESAVRGDEAFGRLEGEIVRLFLLGWGTDVSSGLPISVTLSLEGYRRFRLYTPLANLLGGGRYPEAACGHCPEDRALQVAWTEYQAGSN